MLRPELQADVELLRDAGGIPGAGGEGGGRVARPMRADQQLLGGLQPPRDPPPTVRQPRGGQPGMHSEFARIRSFNTDWPICSRKAHAMTLDIKLELYSLEVILSQNFKFTP